jgi:glycosyltransferase involved in cell wall biosynthesis
MTKRILALNAYHGGSHRVFLDGWRQHSRHEFTLLTLPAFQWKWRMRHAAVTFSEQVAQQIAAGHHWDAVFCTDMLNLAEFLGLCPPSMRCVPTIVYFHENQLTYPVPAPDPRDLHFAFTNLTTALAASAVWFNSAFHRDEFLEALERWLCRMPDQAPRRAIAAIRAKSEIHPPGIEIVPVAERPAAAPLRIVWVSRWEYDKAPETFFHGLFQLSQRGCDFRVSVLGERFTRVPEVFGLARTRLSEHIDHWGYLENPRDYHAVLAGADVVVSTAKHEFFGIGVLEAVAAGCLPLVPRRLAYPQILGDHPAFYHEDTPAALADRLLELAHCKQKAAVWPAGLEPAALVHRFAWPIVAAAMDDVLDRTKV